MVKYGMVVAEYHPHNLIQPLYIALYFWPKLFVSKVAVNSVCLLAKYLTNYWTDFNETHRK